MDAEEANKFINSLVKNLQVLCHGHVNFNNSIQVIGHLYLNVDSQTNIDYIVNEKVCKNDTSSTVFVSNSYHSEQPQKKNAKQQDNGLSQNNKNNNLELEGSVDLTDDGRMVQRLVPISFGSPVDPPAAIHPAYRDQIQSTPTPHHHSRKSRKPFHNIEARSPPAKTPRLSITPIHRTLLNRNNDSVVKHDKNLFNSSQISLGSDFSSSNIPDTSVNDNTASPSQIDRNQDDSEMEPSLRNIKSEPGEEPDPNNSNLFDQQMGSNSSQLGQNSDASADEEFFSGLRDKTLGVFPVALHTSDQVIGSDDYSSLVQPSTSSFKTEMGDLDSGAGNLDSSLNVSVFGLKTNTQMNIYECRHCGVVYSNKNSLYSHMNDKHRQDKFICSVCKRAFSRKYHLQRHLSSHVTHDQSIGHLLTQSTVSRGPRMSPSASEALQLRKRLYHGFHESVEALGLFGKECGSDQDVYIVDPSTPSSHMLTSQSIYSSEDCPSEANNDNDDVYDSFNPKSKNDYE